MSSVTRPGLRALILAATVALPGSATAEPITITGGHLEAGAVDPFARAVFEGTGGFLLDIGIEAFASSLSLSCTPCTPGATLNLGGMLAGPRAAGRAVVDGVVYSQIFVDGITGTFESPSFQISGSGDVTVTRPFSFSGLVNGFIVDPFVDGFTEPVFTKELAGRGTATGTFLFSDTEEPLFTAHTIRYEFTSAQSPVPEPTTMLLCGAGAAIAALRRRRRTSREAHRP